MSKEELEKNIKEISINIDLLRRAVWLSKVKKWTRKSKNKIWKPECMEWFWSKGFIQKNKLSSKKN